MFEFKKQPVKLIKVSMPMENHGQELKMGTVLTCVVVLPASSLAMFGAGLRDSFYRLPTEEEKADLATNPDEPCMLRHPRMSSFAWEFESEGYSSVVDYGRGGDSDIQLADCKVKEIEITPLEQALVQYKFNLNCHPDQREVGALGAKQKQDIDMELRAPASTNPQGNLLPADQKKSKKQQHADAKAQAEAAFKQPGENADAEAETAE